MPLKQLTTRFLLTSSRPFIRAITLSLVLFIGSTYAQEALPTRGMTLGAHAFSPTTFIDNPFVRTYVRNSLGFGLTPNLRIPLTEIGRTEYSWNTGQLLYALMRFEFQGELREWLALKVQVNVTGRLANSTIPLITQGVVLVSGFELGGLFTVYRSSDVQLSLSAGVLNAGVTDVDIRRFVNALIDSGQLNPEVALVTSTPAMRAFTDARLAYGINDLFGIMAQARLLYGESTDRSTSGEWFSSFALFLDLNPSLRWDVPVGFGIGAKTHKEPGRANEGSRSLQSIFGRVGYVGAMDFDLGLDLSYTWIPLGTSPEKTAYVSAIVDVRLLF